MQCKGTGAVGLPDATNDGQIGEPDKERDRPEDRGEDEHEKVVGLRVAATRRQIADPALDQIVPYEGQHERTDAKDERVGEEGEDEEH